ncbi:MAG: response regulator [Bacteroidales bacterium]|nr:response regulator [Bacteroidales bacterium]MCF8328598.1 response regulator [Bacteroidales bacterium]
MNDIQNFTLEDKKILIVEDEESNYDLLRVILKKYKPQIFWAKDGGEAIKMSKEEHFDLILMDLQLPVVSGLEATREIKKNYPDIPIIAQTAYVMTEDRQKAYDAGCDGYIAKPLKRKHLIELIYKHIEK